MTKYAKIGEEPQKGQSKKIWTVPIDEYRKIDPKEYFVTTGEATVKIDILLEDIKELSNELRKLKRQLIKTKGDSDYLETCWESSELLIKKKEKRGKH